MPSGRQQRAEELLRALLSLYLDKSSPHALGAGADIRSVFLVDPGVAVIDVNSAFADTHRSGVLVEELTVASLIHTISANTPGILKVKILVDGKERATLAGHADLSSFYDVTRGESTRHATAIGAIGRGRRTSAVDCWKGTAPRRRLPHEALMGNIGPNGPRQENTDDAG